MRVGIMVGSVERIRESKSWMKIRVEVWVVEMLLFRRCRNCEYLFRPTALPLHRGRPEQVFAVPALNWRITHVFLHDPWWRRSRVKLSSAFQPDAASSGRRTH